MSKKQICLVLVHTNQNTISHYFEQRKKSLLDKTLALNNFYYYTRPKIMARAVGPCQFDPYLECLKHFVLIGDILLLVFYDDTCALEGRMDFSFVFDILYIAVCLLLYHACREHALSNCIGWQKDDDIDDISPRLICNSILKKITNKDSQYLLLYTVVLRMRKNAVWK